MNINRQKKIVGRQNLRVKSSSFFIKFVTFTIVSTERRIMQTWFLTQCDTLLLQKLPSYLNQIMYTSAKFHCLITLNTQFLDGKTSTILTGLPSIMVAVSLSVSCAPTSKAYCQFCPPGVKAYLSIQYLLTWPIKMHSTAGGIRLLYRPSEPRSFNPHTNRS